MSSQSLTDKGYRTIISCSLANGDGTYTDYDVEFDYCSSVRVSSKSTVTSYPIVSGDYIADHMYRNPTTVSISAAYSIYGNKPTSFSDGSYSDRLSNIEDFFEKVLKAGVFCTITTINRSDNAQTRFLARENMVLESITWKENQSYVEADFNFKEAITVDIDEVLYETDVTDTSIPAQTDLKTVSFTSELLDTTYLEALIMEAFINSGCCSDSFVESLCNYVTNYGLETVGVVAGATIGILGGIILGASLTGVGVVVAGVVCIGIAVISLINKYKNTSYTKALYDDFEEDSERFLNDVNNVTTQINLLNDYISAYTLYSNEEQEAMVYIANYYYVFEFTKNNADDNNWYVQVRCMDGQTTSGTIVVSSQKLTGLKHIGECTKSNMLFTVENTNTSIYVFNTALYVAEENGATEDEIAEIEQDLTNYIFLVTEMDMSEFTTTLSDIIDGAIQRVVG